MPEYWKLPSIGQCVQYFVFVFYIILLCLCPERMPAAQAAVAGSSHVLFILKAKEHAPGADFKCLMMTAATLCTVMHCSVGRHLMRKGACANLRHAVTGRLYQESCAGVWANLHHTLWQHILGWRSVGAICQAHWHTIESLDRGTGTIVQSVPNM